MERITEKPVDIYNEFCYNGIEYKISSVLKQYEVTNYPVFTNGKYNDWTNNCAMDSVIVLDYHNGERIKFLDQNGMDITEFIKQV